MPSIYKYMWTIIQSKNICLPNIQLKKDKSEIKEENCFYCKLPVTIFRIPGTSGLPFSERN